MGHVHGGHEGGAPGDESALRRIRQAGARRSGARRVGGVQGQADALGGYGVARHRDLRPHRRHCVPGVPRRGPPANVRGPGQRHHRLPAPDSRRARGDHLRREPGTRGRLRAIPRGRRSVVAGTAEGDPRADRRRRPGWRARVGDRGCRRRRRPLGQRRVVDAPGGAEHGGGHGDGQVGVQVRGPRDGDWMAHGPGRRAPPGVLRRDGAGGVRKSGQAHHRGCGRPVVHLPPWFRAGVRRLLLLRVKGKPHKAELAHFPHPNVRGVVWLSTPRGDAGRSSAGGCGCDHRRHLPGEHARVGGTGGEGGMR